MMKVNSNPRTDSNPATETTQRQAPELPRVGQEDLRREVEEGFRCLEGAVAGEQVMRQDIVGILA